MNSTLLLTLPALCLSLVLTACGGKCQGANCSGNGDEDGGDLSLLEPVIKVGGNIRNYPPAVGYLTDAGLPIPALTGLTLRIEEPLDVALNPNTNEGVFYSTTLADETAAFLAPEVDTAKVKTGIATGVRDDQDAGNPRVIRAASVVYDELLKGAAKADIAGAVGFALPTAFYERLNTTITTATGANLPNGSLIRAGFIVGQMLDGNGTPIAGVTVVPDSSVSSTKFFYPSVDFASATQAGTSANGMFVFVHTGSTTPATFNVTFQQGGAALAGFFDRRAGAATDAALIMQVIPGR